MDRRVVSLSDSVGEDQPTIPILIAKTKGIDQWQKPFTIALRGFMQPQTSSVLFFLGNIIYIKLAVPARIAELQVYEA